MKTCANFSIFRAVLCTGTENRTKFVLKTKKYVAHDEENNCNVGDTVKIMETRPISKSKCWRMVEIIERAK